MLTTILNQIEEFNLNHRIDHSLEIAMAVKRDKLKA